MKIFVVNTILAIALLVTMGCAPKGYSNSAIGQQMEVKQGVVQSVKKVMMNSRGIGNTLGGVVGTVAGAAIGNQVGGGSGKVVASVLGSALGGVLGGTVGDRLDTDYGQEIVIKLNNGRVVATVLRINGATSELHVGEAVNVFFTGSEISNIPKL